MEAKEDSIQDRLRIVQLAMHPLEACLRYDTAFEPRNAV